ncbi:DNA-3-methyladenine glycosylase I [Azospirillum brasilense]|uniref:DNA-3-methyladenine glycosylase I n=1 Tax=Azospirillum brasilense TaxID=192 RepID=A0A6L3AX71_AZOBR|nr:DNA-3-methyladenine glycosylase I [Azospirillum brasilense]KAA0682569.1 DNA-3-methyladenine glycosylase I [Azospirillum brasilense]
MSLTYCDAAPGHAHHGPYHDTEYGFPSADDRVLFERLILEINQAGLSWLTILKKRDAFRAAFDGFDIDRVAAYGEAERERLLADPGIVRNRLKIDAAIENARRIIALRGSHGSFDGWLRAHHPLSKADWVRLFKRTFRFTGGEITGEFLMSLGYLPGAHQVHCPVWSEVATLDPPWMIAVRQGFAGYDAHRTGISQPTT